MFLKPSVLNETLAAATDFYWRHFGHFAAALPGAFAREIVMRDDVECEQCGRQGPGYYDGRSNHRRARCLGCQSFYAQAALYFRLLPKCGGEPKGGKDYTIYRLQKRPLIVDERGLHVYLSANERDRLTPAMREGLPGAHYHSPSAAGRTAYDLAMEDVLSGVYSRAPMLWFWIDGKNKSRGFEVLEMSFDPSGRALAGAAVYCDFKKGPQRFDLDAILRCKAALLKARANGLCLHDFDAPTARAKARCAEKDVLVDDDFATLHPWRKCDDLNTFRPLSIGAKMGMFDVMREYGLDELLSLNRLGRDHVFDAVWTQDEVKAYRQPIRSKTPTPVKLSPVVAGAAESVESVDIGLSAGGVRLDSFGLQIPLFQSVQDVAKV
jgi:hypothetical protein